TRRLPCPTRRAPRARRRSGPLRREARRAATTSSPARTSRGRSSGRRWAPARTCLSSCARLRRATRTASAPHRHPSHDVTSPPSPGREVQYAVPRNAEVIRQWTILREIENARGGGVTIDELAAQCAVTTRTIRRDLQALEEAGFPLYDDRSGDDGRTRWRVNGQAFKGLSAGLTVSELCALYFSRTLVESLSGTPFRSEVESAFEKLSAVLTPHMRRFLDQLPRVIASKADAVRRPGSPRQQEIVAR